MTRFPARFRRPLPPLLVLALVAGLASAQTTSQSPSAKSAAVSAVVIRLGDQTETLGDFEARFEIAIRGLAAQQHLPLTPQLRQQLASYQPQYLQQRATEMVLLARARHGGLTVDQKHVDSVMNRIESNVPKGKTLQDLLTQAGFQNQAQLQRLIDESDLIQQELSKLSDAVKLTDNQLKTFYQAHQSDYAIPEQVCASHILLKTEADAEAVIKDLASGTDFAKEAKAKSTGPSASRGGSLGCFGKGQMVKAFSDAAFNAPVGKVIGPVKTQYGYHVILVSKHSKAAIKPFDQVKNEIESKLRQQHVDQQVLALVKASGVQTFPDRLPQPPTPKPSAPSGSGSAPGGGGSSTAGAVSPPTSSGSGN